MPDEHVIPEEMETAQDETQAEPAGSIDELLAEAEAEELVVSRVIGGKRYSFKRILDGEEWEKLVDAANKTRDFAAKTKNGYVVTQDEEDPEKRVIVRNASIVWQARMLLGILTDPAPESLQKMCLLAKKRGPLFNALIAVALKVNGEELMEAAGNE